MAQFNITDIHSCYSNIGSVRWLYAHPTGKNLTPILKGNVEPNFTLVSNEEFELVRSDEDLMKVMAACKILNPDNLLSLAELLTIKKKLLLKEVEGKVERKKLLFGAKDISEKMCEEEKALNALIASKYSEINAIVKRINK